MAIQVRRGNEADFDPSKMLPGEWAVSLDTKYVRMCFSPGVCLRMATYEAFEADMAKIEAILEEAQTIEEAIEKLQTEINATAVEVENYARSAEASAKEAKEYAEAAAESASKAEALTGPVVSGIKGSAETDFRTGKVTIFPEDLGLGDVLEMLGNVGGITAKFFNRTIDNDWFSTISNVDDIPVNWIGYVTTAMGASAEGFLICLGFPNHSYRLQINISLYGGKVVYRYLVSSTWSEWTELVKGTDLAKYLPLTGGYVDGNVVPKTDSTKLLGVDTLAWLAVYANQFNLLKGGQSYGSVKVMSEGTAEALGYTQLTLGNATPLGTEKNSRGQIALYGTGTGFVQITPTNSGSETFEVKLPSTGGTLALTSDITALNTLTTAEQNAVTHFIENVFPNQSVAQGVPSGSFVIASDYYAWHGMRPFENYATYVIYGYNIRVIHMQLNNGVWTYNAMDNK